MESDDDDLSFLSLVKRQSSSHHHHHQKTARNHTILTIPSDDDDDEDDIATLRASQSLVGIGGDDDDTTTMTMDKLHETQEIWSPLTTTTTTTSPLTTTTPHHNASAKGRSTRVRNTDLGDKDDGSQHTNQRKSRSLQLSKVVVRRSKDHPTTTAPPPRVSHSLERPSSSSSSFPPHRPTHAMTSVLESTVTAASPCAVTQEKTTLPLVGSSTMVVEVDPTPPIPTAPSSNESTQSTKKVAKNTARQSSFKTESSAHQENVTESQVNRRKSDNTTTKRRNTDVKKSSAEKDSVTKSTSRITAPTKKLTFQEQVVVLMLNALKPFTLKLLSEELKTSESSVNFVLLSLVDKGLVVTKDFAAGKNGRVKTLYWANHDVTTKDLHVHRSEPASAAEWNAAHAKMMELKNEIATVRNQWQQVLLTPSNDDLTHLMTTQEAEWQALSRSRDLVRERIAAAPHGAVPGSGGPMMMTTMMRVVKQRIHQYRDEWIQRKRKCLEFVEQLADGLEKKPKHVIQLCDIDTDEMNQVVLPAKYPIPK